MFDDHDDRVAAGGILVEYEIQMTRYQTEIARRLTEAVDQMTVGGWRFVAEDDANITDLREALAAFDAFPPRPWWRW
jgi:glutamate formiminotransferase